MNEEQYQQFCRYLATGPAVFGENHSMPFARNTAIYMIQAGLVKKLFVERAEFPIAGKEPGEMLREHAEKIREGYLYYGDPVDEIGLAPANMGAGDNPTTWRDVVRYAVTSGVDVFYFDKSVCGDAGSDENMAVRNAAMAQVFNDNTEGLGIGMLMINGSSHVNGDEKTGDLHIACKIEDERVFIFPESYQPEASTPGE